MTRQQRDALDQLLRDAPLDLGGDVAEQRVIFEEMMAALAVPADVTTSSGSLDGIPVVNVEAAGADHASVAHHQQPPELSASQAGQAPATAACRGRPRHRRRRP